MRGTNRGRERQTDRWGAGRGERRKGERRRPALKT